MALFGSKKPTTKTFVVLDIETGSVGGTLVHTTPGELPRLLGETRVDIAPAHHRNTHIIRDSLGGAINTVAQTLAHVAARVRGHDATTHMGTPARAVVFMAAPWGVPNLQAGTPWFNDELSAEVRAALNATFDIPVSFHAHASAVLNGARTLFPYEDAYLICMPHGEVTETLEVVDGAVRAYGTLPVGRHTMLRTFMAHAGLSEPESRSALKAFSLGHEVPLIREPLRHAQEHIASHFNQLANHHQWHTHTRVYSFAHDGDWFARALAKSTSAQKFADGAIMKAIRETHMSPHFSAHAHNPDLGVMLDALFVDSHYR